MDTLDHEPQIQDPLYGDVPVTTDGARVTPNFLQPLFGGAVNHEELSRCRTCWSVVFKQDEDRHMASHRDNG